MAINGVKTWVDKLLSPFIALKEAVAQDQLSNETNKSRIDDPGTFDVKTYTCISTWFKKYWYVPLIILVFLYRVLSSRR